MFEFHGPLYHSAIGFRVIQKKKKKKKKKESML